MKLGIVFPQLDIGVDPDVIASFATTAESLGFDHLIAYDHVLGADTIRRPDWRGPYTSKSAFHEPFVLFSYLAALTRQLELVSAVIILPQRQTALVAKQAACLDVLARGRLRLGIGTGWNAVEYEALGENFHNRGRRSEEQVALLRALWAEEVVTFNGRWHTVTEAGLNPLPAKRSIPVWFGGMADAVIDRVARVGDGWFPFRNPQLPAQLAQLRERARAAGRDPASIGIECMQPAVDAPEKIRERCRELEDLGVTHTAGVTMNAGLDGPQAHIDAMKRFRDAVR